MPLIPPLFTAAGESEGADAAIGGEISARTR